MQNMKCGFLIALALAIFASGLYFNSLVASPKPEAATYDEIMLRIPKEPDLKLVRKQILLNKAQLTILLQLEEWEKKKK